MLEDQLQEIEISIETAKEASEKMHALLRLTKNPDFQLIIDTGFFEKEASRVVLLKADPEMQKPEDQEALDKIIIAIGQLRQYFRTLIAFGRMAEKSIAEDQHTRQELLAEAIDAE